MDKKLDKKIFSKNLKFLRESSGRTQEQLADILNTTRANITSWEIAKSAPKTFGTYRLIADFFRITVDDLFFTDLQITKEKDTPISSKRLTVYGKVCAGDGKTAFEDPIDEITNPYHRLNGDLFALQVDGDSMNKIVLHGDYAIIQKQPVVKNGEIAVVLIDNDIAMLKRFYQVDSETIVLKPESTDSIYKAITFIGEEINNLKIIGRYVGAVKPMENLI